MNKSTRDTIADYFIGLLVGICMFFASASPTYVIKIVTFGAPIGMVFATMQPNISLRRRIWMWIGFLPPCGFWLWYVHDKITLH